MTFFRGFLFGTWTHPSHRRRSVCVLSNYFSGCNWEVAALKRNLLHTRCAKHFKKMNCILDLPGPWKSRPLAEFPLGAKIKIKKDTGFVGPWELPRYFFAANCPKLRLCLPHNPGSNSSGPAFRPTSYLSPRLEAPQIYGPQRNNPRIYRVFPFG